MGDGTGRGSRRGFEPPPWEIDQFEELARRRAAEPAEPGAEDLTEATGGERSAVGGAQAEASEGAVDDGLDHKLADAMLVQLSGQEGSALKPAMRASRVAAIALAIVGAAMLVAGAVTAAGFAASGPVGALGAGTIVVFGAFIFGVAVWLWVRASRAQGS